MDSNITYLFTYSQYLISIIFQLLTFIAKHIPLKQLAFDDSVSQEYQKFNPHVMGFSLTYHMNLKLSTRQTAKPSKGFMI